MATTRRITRKEMKRDQFVSAMGRFTLWVEEHVKETLVLAGAVVVLIIAAVLFYQYLGQREEKASALLGRGVVLLQAGVRGPGTLTTPPGTSTFNSEPEKYRAVLDQVESVIQTYPRSRAGRLALYYKGLALERLGRGPEAIKTLEGYLRTDSGGFAVPLAKAALARLHSESGAPEKAVALYEELAGDTDGAFPPPAALWEMGLCLERMGKTEEARKVFERITREFPDSEYSREADRRLQGRS